MLILVQANLIAELSDEGRYLRLEILLLAQALVLELLQYSFELLLREADHVV